METAGESQFAEEHHWVRVAISVLEQRSEIRSGEKVQNCKVTS